MNNLKNAERLTSGGESGGVASRQFGGERKSCTFVMVW